MRKLVTAATLAAILPSEALAQSFDPHLGTGNLNPTFGTYVAPACDVRRMQFSDAFGWRVRDVRVCCNQGQCSYSVSPY